MWKCVEHRIVAKVFEHGLPRRCAADWPWVDEEERRTHKNGPCCRRSQVRHGQTGARRTCKGKMTWRQEL